MEEDGFLAHGGMSLSWQFADGTRKERMESRKAVVRETGSTTEEDRQGKRRGLLTCGLPGRVGDRQQMGWRGGADFGSFEPQTGRKKL